jgi:hypothetical protein
LYARLAALQFGANEPASGVDIALAGERK